MRESAMVVRQMMVTVLEGTSSLRSTWPIQLLKGRPLSRAKAHVWREVEGLKDTVPAKIKMVGMTLRATTPPGDTACRETFILPGARLVGKICQVKEALLTQI